MEHLKFKCRGLLLHLITRSDKRARTHTHTHTHTLGTAAPDEGSPHLRGLYLHNSQHAEETSTHAPGVIRTRNPSK